MSKRKEFEMTKEQHDKLMEACKPVPMIALQCGTPASPQENANAAWATLGKELGFKPFTVEPGRSPYYFTAELVDTPLFCPQCSNQTPELVEGHCRSCRDQNQRELDQFNEAQDIWKKLKPKQRERLIKMEDL